VKREDQLEAAKVAAWLSAADGLEAYARALPTSTDFERQVRRHVEKAVIPALRRKAKGLLARQETR
jgi:hypothetical protein